MIAQVKLPTSCLIPRPKKGGDALDDSESEEESMDEAAASSRVTYNAHLVVSSSPDVASGETMHFRAIGDVRIFKTLQYQIECRPIQFHQ